MTRLTPLLSLIAGALWGGGARNDDGEHQLIIDMLAIQMQKFQVLLDVLREEGRLTLANLSRIETQRALDIGQNLDLREKIAADYRAAAK